MLCLLKKNNNELDKLILANILRAFDHNFEMNGKAHCESIAPATAIDLSKETFFFSSSILKIRNLIVSQLTEDANNNDGV